MRAAEAGRVAAGVESRGKGAAAQGRLARLALLCAPALLAASAIAHAVGGAAAGGTAVVAVSEGPAAVATGFTITPGRVITVAHVLEGDEAIVRGSDGVALRAAVVRRDDALDLAVLAVPGLEQAVRPPTAGTRVLVRRDGRVSALPARVVRRITARVTSAGETGVAVRPALELTADVAAGDSGAPVLRDGRIAGILFARSNDRPGVAYAVDASELDGLVRQR